MSATIKKTLLAILTAVLTVCAGFLLFPIQSASADMIDTETTDTLSCDGFKFTTGASINSAKFVDYEYQLGFPFSVTNAVHSDLLKYNTDNPGHYLTIKNAIGIDTGARVLAPDRFNHYFTVYRSNGDGKTATKLAVVFVHFQYIEYNGTVALEKWVLQKNVTPSNEIIGLDEVTLFDVSYTAEEITNKKPTSPGFEEYDVLSAGILISGGIDVGQKISVTCESPYTSYFVGFSYEYKLATKVYYPTLSAQLSADYNIITDSCRSSTRSIYGVLKSAQDAEALEDMFWDYDADVLDETAYNIGLEILSNQDKERVKVKYLKQIDGTPFAEPVFSWVNVPVTSEGVYLDDVALALGLDTLNCMGSICQNLVFDEDEDVYSAYYLKNSWIEARTTDENKANYFFDINTSFKDYFYTFVEDGIFDPGAYEYVWANQVLKEFPILEKYDASELYGLFGVVVVPESYTWGSILENVFGDGGKVSTGDIQSYFYFEDTIEKADYNLLLDKYGYNHIETAWSNVAGDWIDYKATYFLFLANPGFERIQDGDEDTDTPTDEVIDNIEDGIFNGPLGGCSGGSGCSSGLGCGGGCGSGGCLSGDFGTIIIIAGIGFAVYYFFFRDNGKKGKRK